MAYKDEDINYKILKELAKFKPKAQSNEIKEGYAKKYPELSNDNWVGEAIQHTVDRQKLERGEVPSSYTAPMSSNLNVQSSDNTLSVEDLEHKVKMASLLE